jgi:hypothetical protein
MARMEFVLNLQAVSRLGIEASSEMLARASDPVA